MPWNAAAGSADLLGVRSHRKSPAKAESVCLVEVLDRVMVEIFVRDDAR